MFEDSFLDQGNLEVDNSRVKVVCSCLCEKGNQSTPSMSVRAPGGMRDSETLDEVLTAKSVQN